jgi:hypothetical protein
MSTTAQMLTVVTGADSRYARCLWQMLRSAERHRLEKRHRFVAFDLGLGESNRSVLERRFPWCLMRAAGPDRLPPHASIASRTYAWKPIVLHRAAGEFGGCLLWLDSATLFHGGLDEVLTVLGRFGTYTLSGQSQLQERCEPEVWSSMGAPLEILDRPERVAGVVGIDYDHQAGRRILDRWVEAALDPRHWRPISTRHMPEQAILSILLHTDALKGELALNPDEVDISSASPVRFISTRNKVPLWMPRILDPLVRGYYAAYKTADRPMIRLRRFKAERIDGWHRMLREHFTVRIGPRDAVPSVTVPNPEAGYYADPFVYIHRETPWLFLEYFSYARNAGRLVALPLGGGLSPGPAQALDIPGRHVSFPAIFGYGGGIYLVPETSTNRTIDLYVCADFPSRWRLARRLLADIDAADSVLVEHGGRWWLVTSIRDETRKSGRYLGVFHTDDLFGGRFIAHPVNRERRYASAPHNSGRCGGNMVRSSHGTLLRPAHRNTRHYGEGIVMMRVTRLDPECFEEAECAPGDPDLPPVAGLASHHVFLGESIVAHDFRDRASYADLFRLRGFRMPSVPASVR